MRSSIFVTFGLIVSVSFVGAGVALADPGGMPTPAAGDITTGSIEKADSPSVVPDQMMPAVLQQFNRTPFGDALERELTDEVAGLDTQDQLEQDAIVSFYTARDFKPYWITEAGPNPQAHLVASEIRNAGAWGLDPKAFVLPKLASLLKPLEATLVMRAKTELSLTRNILKYARHARGGRIMNPSEMLNSNLDRKPKLIDPKLVLRGLADSQDVASYLHGLHPAHPDFQNLRHAYLARRAKAKIKGAKSRSGNAPIADMTEKQIQALRNRLGLRSVEDRKTARVDLINSDLQSALGAFQSRVGIEPADGVLTRATVRALNKRPKVSSKRLLANMEQWRWMWEDMGDVHVFANVPEYILRVVKDGSVIHTERIVVGETGKQTSIFTRTLKHIVLRPMWRVPESIKVRELWPNLKGSGSLFRKFGLRLETKDGKRLDYRKINWSKDDIRRYEVVQPPGRKSVMGVVKFSFPSQHTIYMHDTPDKYMFKRRRRTLSHGCLRLRNPMKVARLLLLEDKNWTSAHVDQLAQSGPSNNQIEIEGRIPMHLAYFTVRADRDGTVHTFRDIYGHEKRVSLALQGQWKKIRKGRDHLAAVQPLRVSSKRRATNKRRRKRGRTPGEMARAGLGGGF